METGGCRMGGAGPGGPAAITLEELDGLAEESPDSAYHSHGSSLEEEPAERMDDEEQERLLSYWQSVGRGHQVDVPRGKAGIGLGTWGGPGAAGHGTEHPAGTPGTVLRDSEPSKPGSKAAKAAPGAMQSFP